MRLHFCISTALIALVFGSTTSAQQGVPTPDQAPFILTALDRDQDKRISEQEAPAGPLKDNFALLDSDGDGGINLEELKRALEMASAQAGGGGDSDGSNATAAGEKVFDKVEHREVDNDGVTIHYVTLGEGPVILFVHGFPDYWYTWREQIAALSSDYQTVAMDTRAYNKSGAPESVQDYAMPHLMSDVEAVIKDLGVESVTLVGHDWGGAISWQFAMNHPELVNHLVICNLTHPIGYATVRKNATAEQKANTKYITDFQTPGFENRLTPEVLVNISAGNASQIIKERYLQAFTDSSVKGMLSYYRAAFKDLSTDPADAKLPNLKMPVLQFHGLKDSAVDKDGLRDTWNWIDAEYTLVTLPETDHWVQREAADTVSRTIRSWLGRQTSR